MNILHKFSLFILIVLGIFLVTNPVDAQNSCDLSGFVTYTQGGWGSPSNSTPGGIRDNNFAQVFPNGLTLGTNFKTTLTTAQTVMGFLPQGGTSGAFSQNYTDPTSTSAGVLAGQAAALTLSVKYNAAGVLGQNSLKLEDLVIASGDLAGKSVKELLDLINKALGGESVGYTFSQLNNAATSINENFDNGTVNKGFLTCPSASASLGDKVWYDSNQNGIQDAGEAGVSNVRVELHNCSDNSLLSTKLTDANGLYLFTNLAAASYYVKFVVPEGYTVSLQTQGTDRAKDSDPDQSGKTSCISLNEGEHNLSVDAGIFTQTKSDIAILKTVSKNNPECGENITYSVKLTNNGPDRAQNIEVRDLLPAGLVFVSYTATSGTYDNTSGKWSVAGLDNGASATLSISVTVDCSVFNNNTIDLGPAKGFNLFVLGNLTQPSSDTQGRVAVGGDASLANYSIGDVLPQNSGDVLVVGGSLTFTTGRVYNGNVVYGTSSNLPQYSVSIDNGTLRQGHPVDFAQAKTYLGNLSSSLANYNANGSTEFKWGKLTLNGIDPFLNVFMVSGTDLANANDFEVNAPNGSVVVVNISGTEDKWTGGLVINGTSNALALFNFYEAQKLNIQGIDLRGTLLAPLADLSFPAGLISGQAIVKSMTGSGQFNNVLFIGNIPVSTAITNTAQVVSDITNDPDASNNSSQAAISAEYKHSTGTGAGDNGGSTGGTDNGNNTGTNNWQTVCSFGAGEIIYTMVYHDNVVYAGTWGGHVYKSVDAGANWTTINTGLSAAYIWSLTFHNGVLFASTENGVYSFDGTKWTAANLSGKDVHVLLSQNGVLYAGTWGFGIFKSTDNGAHWAEANSGLNGFLAIQSLTSDTKGSLYAGTANGGIFSSANGGQTWSKTSCAYDYIWSLGSTSNAIFAGTYGDGLYRSTDGLSWSKLTSSPSPFIYSVVVDGAGKIYASSWTNGVFTSTDNGNTWSPLGLGGLGVSSVAVNPASHNVFIGTNSGTVYQSILKLSNADVKAQLPASFDLSQNYPNPFNPSTTIEFSVPKNGSYTLKVYDMLGKEVTTLISGQFNPGVYRATFNSNGLASGIYFYRLSGENVNLIKKMMLMK